MDTNNHGMIWDGDKYRNGERVLLAMQAAYPLGIKQNGNNDSRHDASQVIFWKFATAAQFLAAGRQRPGVLWGRHACLFFLKKNCVKIVKVRGVGRNSLRVNPE